MKHYLAELTGSSTTTGSLNVGGTLSIPGHDDVSASLASISASAANSVSSFTDLTNVPSGLVSASAQVDFDSIQNTNNIVSSSAQIASDISGAFVTPNTVATASSVHGGTVRINASGSGNSALNIDSSGGIDIDSEGDVNVNTTNGGVFLDANGGGSGDITLNAEDRIRIQAADDITLDANGTTPDGGIFIQTNRVLDVDVAGTIGLNTTNANGTITIETANGIIQTNAYGNSGRISNTTDGNFSVSAGGEIRFTGSALHYGTDASPNILGIGANGRLQTTNINISAEGALSSSAQIATDISGAFDAASASLASDIAGITTFTTAGTDIVSGSAQIATNISGAFDAASASLASDIAGITTFTTAGTGIHSGSAQVTSALLNQNLNLGTGTLTANELITNIVSSSVLLTTGSNIFGDETSDVHEFTGSVEMQNDLTVSGDISGTFINVISESAQIATDISGAFDAASASLASDIAGITTFTTAGTGIFSGSAQLPSGIISGSTQLNSLTNPITGSFTGSFVGDGSGLTGVTSTVEQTATVTSSFSNVSSVSVSHGFGTQDVFVQAYLDDNSVFYPDSIVATDEDTVDVTFASSRSGRIVVGKAGHIVSGSADRVVNQNTDSGSIQFWHGSQTEYDAISSSADANTIYFVV